MRDLFRRAHEPEICRDGNGGVLQSRDWRLRLRVAAFVCSAMAALAACQSVQTTSPGVVGVNRQQHFLVSEEQVQAAAAQAYQQQLAAARAENKLNADANLTSRVRRIARNLVPATATFRPDAPGWSWEINTLATDELNAYAMPGGKIMVYEGIVERLNLTDAEIAAIVGHEIAHALREHSRERVSRQYAQQVALAGAAILTDAGANVLDLADTVATVTFQLPFSREQESEADRVGLELMARAGYDPKAAASLWNKMLDVDQQRQPQFLSTHPDPAARIEDIERLIPKVLPLYRATGRDQPEDLSLAQATLSLARPLSDRHGERR